MKTAWTWAWALALNFVAASGMEDVLLKGRYEWQEQLRCEYIFAFSVWGLMAALAVFRHIQIARDEVAA